MRAGVSNNVWHGMRSSSCMIAFIVKLHEIELRLTLWRHLYLKLQYVLQNRRKYFNFNQSLLEGGCTSVTKRTRPKQTLNRRIPSLFNLEFTLEHYSLASTTLGNIQRYSLWLGRIVTQIVTRCESLARNIQKCTKDMVWRKIDKSCMNMQTFCTTKNAFPAILILRDLLMVADTFNYFILRNVYRATQRDP